MITIRLLGGAKKALGGRDSIQLEKPIATISEILHFLQNHSTDPRLLNPTNLILAINGVDSSALNGQDSAAVSGDIVTVVTVVHGGAFERASGLNAEFIGVRKVAELDIGEFLEKLRKANRKCLIQAVNAASIFGVDHVLEVLRIVVEARMRGIMIADKVEAELLLRIACTRQISEAIRRAGLRSGVAACIIALASKPAELARFRDSLGGLEHDDSVLGPSVRKKNFLTKQLGLRHDTAPGALLKHLVEHAAILTK